MKLVRNENAWADCPWWQTLDRKVLDHLDTLLADMVRNGNEWIGKPEPHGHGLRGY